MRKRGMAGRFEIYTDFASLIILVISTLTSLTKEAKDTEDYAYVNSSIESRSPDKGNKTMDQDATVSEEQEPQHPLSKEEELNLFALERKGPPFIVVLLCSK